jgi:mannan endo-1,4-beta-mannosidase
MHIFPLVRLIVSIILMIALLSGCILNGSNDREAVEIEPSNPDTEQETRALLAKLYSLSGNKILSGQFNYSGNLSDKTRTLEQWSGRTPAIWGSDFDFGGGTAFRQAVVEEAIAQWKSGTLISLTWHASKPGIKEEECGWADCIQAPTDEQEFDTIMTPGTVQHDDLLHKMDEVAGYLKQLQDAGVPVLWRPWHEMNGNWFWWGQHEKTAELWQLMYDRYTEHHGLNNLLWQWNPNAPLNDDMSYSLYYPGHAYVDILAMDLYQANKAAGWKQQYYEELLTLGDNRVIAIGESDYLPKLPVLQDTQPRWVFQMTWDGDWFHANTEQDYACWLNDGHVLTRDELEEPEAEGSPGIDTMSCDDAAVYETLASPAPEVSSEPAEAEMIEELDGWLSINDSTIGTELNQFEYTGTWASAAGEGKWNNDDHYSATVDSSYQIRFEGSGIKLFGTKDAHHGIAAVSIDGGAEVEVDFYADARVDGAVVWTSPVLEPGFHTIQVRVSGTNNDASSGLFITADRAAVKP